MSNLEKIIAEIEEQLDEKDTLRELALKSSRTITRLAGSALRSMHRGEDVSKLLNDAKEEAFKLKKLLRDHPDLYHSGFFEGAEQELCEAFLTFAILKKKNLPYPEELGVTNSPYLLGLADVVGELRRFALDSLRNGNVEEAGKYLETMEDIFNALMRFDYPTALIAIKRKQDIARSLVERTRGEIAVAARGRELEKRIEELKEKL